MNDLIYILGGIIAAVVGIFAYGKSREAKGERRAKDRITTEILKGEKETRDDIRKALDDADDGDPAAARERLRKRLEARRD